MKVFLTRINMVWFKIVWKSDRFKQMFQPRNMYKQGVCLLEVCFQKETNQILEENQTLNISWSEQIHLLLECNSICNSWKDDLSLDSICNNFLCSVIKMIACSCFLLILTSLELSNGLPPTRLLPNISLMSSSAIWASPPELFLSLSAWFMHSKQFSSCSWSLETWLQVLNNNIFQF